MGAWNVPRIGLLALAFGLPLTAVGVDAQPQSDADLIKSLDGARYEATAPFGPTGLQTYTITFQIRGDTAVVNQPVQGSKTTYADETLTIVGRQVETDSTCGADNTPCKVTYTITARQVTKHRETMDGGTFQSDVILHRVK